MTNETTIVDRMRAELQATADQVPGSAWYVFGSTVTQAETTNDLDLMVLCRHGNDVIQVRELLQPLCLKSPVHLFLLTFEEEAEFDFVATQPCVRILPVETANMGDV